jgi:hypothetical protein
LLETYKLEGETENMGVCTKERKGVTAKELMGHSLYDDERRWVLLKIPRGDTDGVGEKVGFIENTARRHRWGG